MPPTRTPLVVLPGVIRIARTAVVAGLALGLLGASARADVVTLKDGRRVEGTVVSETNGVVKVETDAGPLELKKDDVVSIERGKTRSQQFAEREAAAKSADDFHGLGLWARDQKLPTRDVKRCMQRAIEIDPRHAGAHAFLGHVLYKGEWMTTDERDRRQKLDEEREMLARGLVRFEDRWVTPEEREHLARNEVLVDGRWIPFESAQRQKGLELFESRWLPRAEALARQDALAVEKLLGVTFRQHLTDDALLVGPQSVEELEAAAAGLKRGRAWFDATFRSEPGLALLGGRLAEFYMFRDNDAYLSTVEHFAKLTTTVPPGWSDAVKKTHGFLWWDPYPLSSARRWNRGDDDLVGHDYHHWGHLLLNRLGYDGRLLPPWYDEGVAALLEFRSHQRNAVFCRGAKSEPPPGPSTGGTPPRRGETKGSKGAAPAAPVAPFDPKAMRDGNWRAALVAGLRELPAFDKLASLQFNELESADIAASMGIVEWLESRGPNALRAFHDVLRRTAPPAPTRILPNSFERERVYEEAFRAATGLGWREADKAWRAWIATK